MISSWIIGRKQFENKMEERVFKKIKNWFIELMESFDSDLKIKTEEKKKMAKETKQKTAKKAVKASADKKPKAVKKEKK